MQFKNLMIVGKEIKTELFIIDSLKQNNYNNIWSYTSSIDAINGVRSGKIPDLILMDINLKGSEDGLCTASKILKMYQVPIIFMSEYDDYQTVEEVLSISLYGFLSKPFTQRSIQIAVSLACRNFLNNSIEKKTKDYISLSKNCHYTLEDKTILENNNIVSIPYKQKKFLDILIKNINNTVNKRQLSFELWSELDISESSLRTVVYLIKKRFKGINIYSQSKEGYIFRDYAI